MIKRLGSFTINCVIKTFASVCVVFAAVMPYLFWIGFGTWPYIAFLIFTQVVSAMLGIWAIIGIVRTDVID